MPMTSVLPFIAGGLLFIFGLYRIFGSDAPMKGVWVFPAVLAGVFSVFSLYTVAVEGPDGFWIDHTRNLWGNQIWFDLLLAVGIGWFFIAPQAKALNMRLLPWLILVLCTGNIGFLAMVARLLYLREQSGQ